VSSRSTAITRPHTDDFICGKVRNIADHVYSRARAASDAAHRCEGAGGWQQLMTTRLAVR
jgi:hypothetical protein